MKYLTMLLLVVGSLNIQAQSMLVDKGEGVGYAVVGATFGSNTGTPTIQMGYIGSFVSFGLGYGRNFSTDKTKATSNAVGLSLEVVGRLTPKIGLGLRGGLSHEFGVRVNGEPVENYNGTQYQVGPSLQVRVNADNVTIVPQLSGGYQRININGENRWGGDISIIDERPYVRYGMQLLAGRTTTGVFIEYADGIAGGMNIGFVF